MSVCEVGGTEAAGTNVEHARCPHPGPFMLHHRPPPLPLSINVCCLDKCVSAMSPFDPILNCRRLQHEPPRVVRYVRDLQWGIELLPQECTRRMHQNWSLAATAATSASDDQEGLRAIAHH